MAALLDVIRKSFPSLPLVQSIDVRAAFLRKRNLHGDITKIYWTEPSGTLPAPSFGSLIDNYVDVQGFCTNDLWVICDLWSKAFRSSDPSPDAQADMFVSDMTARGMSIFEARFFWKNIEDISQHEGIRLRWAI